MMSPSCLAAARLQTPGPPAPLPPWSCSLSGGPLSSFLSHVCPLREEKGKSLGPSSLQPLSGAPASSLPLGRHGTFSSISPADPVPEERVTLGDVPWEAPWSCRSQEAPGLWERPSPTGGSADARLRRPPVGADPRPEEHPATSLTRGPGESRTQAATSGKSPPTVRSPPLRARWRPGLRAGEARSTPGPALHEASCGQAPWPSSM